MAVVSPVPVTPQTVDRIRLHEIGSPVIMASRQEMVSEPVTPVIEDKVFVAVGKDVKESKLTLGWALERFGGKKICVIYVLVPSQKIRMEGLGAEIPVSAATEQMVRAHRETEKHKMHKLLDDYLRICKQMEVHAEKLFIESNCIEKGIVELIRLHGIRKLVMGAAADKRYSKKMTELKSKKAMSVRDEAPLSCYIWFICSGHLIHTREGSTDQADTDVSSTPRTSSTTDSGRSDLSRTSSVTQHRNDPAKLTNPVQDLFGRVFFHNSEKRGGRLIISPSPDSPLETSTAHSLWSRQGSYPESEMSSRRSPSQSSAVSSCSSSGATEVAFSPLVRPAMSERRSEMIPANNNREDSSPSSILDVNVSDNLYDQLEQAITEAENAKREALQEGVRRAKAEKHVIEGVRRAKALESLYDEELKRRKEVEEALAKEEEGLRGIMSQQEELMEELQRTLDQKSSLESQIVETDQTVKELEQKIISAVELLQNYKQERDELEIERDNALREAEELRRRQGDSASTTLPQYFSEFSFTEIKEATRNFQPSLKIGEGGYGSIYKGFLRHTMVAIKMLHSNNFLQGPQEFQQEVDVLSKVRHPNLVTLIGACPDAWSLVYEYLPNGSLEDRLGCRDNSMPLSWQTRIRIATELCSVLIFLHSSKPRNIVHGDVKPANILLDVHLVSKLSDFGICRLLSHDEHSSDNSTLLYRTDPKGTFAYMDPEFLSTGELTTKSDVYSFGVILLRLLTGRPALGITKEVKYALSNGNLKSLLDPLAGDWPYVQAEQLAHLALRCCEMSRRDRPDLASDVWRILEPMRASCGGLSSFRMGSEGCCQPPPYFICPILQEVMQDPQVAADGFTYEAEALRGWLDSGHDTSPMTNLQLPHTNLVPNRALRSAIQEWLQNN